MKRLITIAYIFIIFNWIDDEFSSISPYQTQQYADCGFWDFAGQKDFYATHQTFLSTNAIYLLVADISKDLTDKTFKDMLENEFDTSGGMWRKLY